MRNNEQNMKKISQLADLTRVAMTNAYNQMKKEGLDIHIFETIRTRAKQQEYLNKGTSKTMRSYHLVGQAVDILPFDSKGNFSWNESLYRTKNHQRVVQIMRSNGFSWGQDMWGWDMPHFQFDGIPYGSDTFTGAKVDPPSSKPVKDGTIYIQAGQEFLNSRDYPKTHKGNFTPLDVDGIAGQLSFDAGVRVYQYFCNITVDGIFGSVSKRSARTLKKEDTRSFWVSLLQTMLNFHGAKLEVDGIFGNGTESALRSFQLMKRILIDGIAGRNTWEQLFKR